MEEKVKNKLIFILAVVCVLFLVLAVSSCNGASRQKLARDKEVAARFNLEEKMSKFSQEKAGLDAEIRAKEKELSEARSELDAVKKALQQEQMVSSSLKDELATVVKVKEGLEAELENVRAKNKKTTR
ncbi:MAG: hypothetical protein ABSE81_00445 [Candidatus Omnitrophota bacterium]|jgi:chromosome segregation ATPase